MVEIEADVLSEPIDSCLPADHCSITQTYAPGHTYARLVSRLVAKDWLQTLLAAAPKNGA